MMHDLLGRLAPYGGEGALCALFAFSVINLAIISHRIWFFARRHINANKFLNQLIPLIRGRDLPRARALSQRADASICSTTFAGLIEAEHGLAAVQEAFATAISYERIILEDKLVALKEAGRLALLVGILGSLFDVLAFASPSQPVPLAEAAIGRAVHSPLIAAVSPLIGGLVVAIPAWFAMTMLNVHVQRILLECEFIARLVSSQLFAEQTKPTSSAQSLRLHRESA